MLIRVVKKVNGQTIYELGCDREGCGRTEETVGVSPGVAAELLVWDRNGEWGSGPFGKGLYCSEHAPPPLDEEDLKRTMLGQIEGTLGMPARFED